MGDSIERCIESIMVQIDDLFEVVIVNDDSIDNTREVLARMSEKYPLLVFKSLKRDPMRKLGHTRNLSFQIANGDWCIFHIDADDIIGPNLKDFTAAVQALSLAFKDEKLYAGKQIHMARREFLLAHGPFRNIYRGEDRDLYERLVKESSWVIIDHKRFIFRMERKKSKLVRKKIFDVTDQTITDLRKSESLREFYIENWKARKRLGGKIFAYKSIISLYAFIKAHKLGKLQPTQVSLQEFVAYRELHTKSLSEWFKEFNLEFPKGIDSEIFY
jgi:glycosyltransferase involved in cell wall biosynthesis